jgi:hypothetical protein
MDQLPEELFDQICGCLPAEALRLASYVSTKLCKAAEEYAGKDRFDKHKLSTEDNLERFVGLYSGFRLRYLQRAEFEVNFPAPEDENRGCRESVEEQYAKDEVFTQQIQTIFAVLKKMEECAGEWNQGAYQLTISVDGYADEYCLHQQHAQLRIHLLDPETLSELTSIVSLCTFNA